MWGPGELFQVEGIYAALLIQRLGNLRLDAAAQQLLSLDPAQRPQLQALQGASPGRLLQRRGQPSRGLPRPQRQRHQHRRLRRAAQQPTQELDGGRIGPVQVVQD
jgi:hypothetical protein